MAKLGQLWNPQPDLQVCRPDLLQVCCGQLIVWINSGSKSYTRDAILECNIFKHILHHTDTCHCVPSTKDTFESALLAKMFGVGHWRRGLDHLLAALFWQANEEGCSFVYCLQVLPGSKYKGSNFDTLLPGKRKKRDQHHVLKANMSSVSSFKNSCLHFLGAK